MTDPLTTNLLDLLYELRNTDIELILGGGFGLFLKREFFAKQQTRTLLSRYPVARATNDLDIFLKTEILASENQTRDIYDVLSRLDYTVIESAKYFQFKRQIEFQGKQHEIKVDLLSGPPGDLATEVRIAARRVKPKSKKLGLHARYTEEAIAVEQETIGIPVEGKLSSGDSYATSVNI